MKLDIPYRETSVTAIKPQSSALGEVVGDYLDMSNALVAFVCVVMDQVTGDAQTVSLYQAKDTAGTDEKVLGKDIIIYASEDIDAVDGDVLVQAADGVDYTVAADIKAKKVLFKVSPEDLDVEGGFSCLNTKVSIGSTDNMVSAEYIILPRVGGQTAK